VDVSSSSVMFFFFSSRRRHTRFSRDWSSDVCSSDLDLPLLNGQRKASELLNIGYFAQHQMDALDGQASPMLQLARLADPKISERSEERRVGKECRSRGSP